MFKFPLKLRHCSYVRSSVFSAFFFRTICAVGYECCFFVFFNSLEKCNTVSIKVGLVCLLVSRTLTGTSLFKALRFPRLKNLVAMGDSRCCTNYRSKPELFLQLPFIVSQYFDHAIFLHQDARSFNQHLIRWLSKAKHHIFLITFINLCDSLSRYVDTSWQGINSHRVSLELILYRQQLNAYVRYQISDLTVSL